MEISKSITLSSSAVYCGSPVRLARTAPAMMSGDPQQGLAASGHMVRAEPGALRQARLPGLGDRLDVPVIERGFARLEVELVDAEAVQLDDERGQGLVPGAFLLPLGHRGADDHDMEPLWAATSWAASRRCLRSISVQWDLLVSRGPLRLRIAARASLAVVGSMMEAATM
ncbi:hypothetical protein [Streptomyces sp. NPDC088707]|uniref:hypothetical protein n=1 Tax=Streptomyces sp. NPDC088707 TaxID=3365871 RepID=UPI0037F772AA